MGSHSSRRVLRVMREIPAPPPALGQGRAPQTSPCHGPAGDTFLEVQGGEAESKVDMGYYGSQRRDRPGGDDPRLSQRIQSSRG